MQNMPPLGAERFEDCATQIGARARLKQATDDVHRRLHRHAGLRQLADGSVDDWTCRRVLMRFYGFYVTLEPLVRHPVASERLRLDLGDLGLSQAVIDAIPRCVALPRLLDPGAPLGARYVLEGAAAGGRLMAAAIATRRREPPIPLRFLCGDGDPDRWAAFVRLLDKDLLDPDQMEAAAAAARDTFLALEVWMGDWERDNG